MAETTAGKLLFAFFTWLATAMKKAFPFLEGVTFDVLRQEARRQALNSQITKETYGTDDDLETLSDSELSDRLRDAAAKRKPIG